MILDEIRHALSTQFDVELESITSDTDIMVDLGADSLDLVDLITELEERYNVSITDESIYQCKTVGDLANYFEDLLI